MRIAKGIPCPTRIVTGACGYGDAGKDRQGDEGGYDGLHDLSPGFRWLAGITHWRMWRRFESKRRRCHSVVTKSEWSGTPCLDVKRRCAVRDPQLWRCGACQARNASMPDGHFILATTSLHAVPMAQCAESPLADLALRLLVRLAATQVSCVRLTCGPRENGKRDQGECDRFHGSSLL